MFSVFRSPYFPYNLLYFYILYKFPYLSSLQLQTISLFTTLPAYSKKVQVIPPVDILFPCKYFNHSFYRTFYLLIAIICLLVISYPLFSRFLLCDYFFITCLYIPYLHSLSLFFLINNVLAAAPDIAIYCFATFLHPVWLSVYFILLSFSHIF